MYFYNRLKTYFITKDPKRESGLVKKQPTEKHLDSDSFEYIVDDILEAEYEQSLRKESADCELMVWEEEDKES